MLTIQQNNKRETKLIRLSCEWHAKVKQKAVDEGKTMSVVLDNLVELGLKQLENPYT